MSAAFDSLHEQNMIALGQQITRFQGDGVTISKASDYSYLQGKELISHTEAMGVERSQNPSGKPGVGSPSEA